MYKKIIRIITVSTFALALLVGAHTVSAQWVAPTTQPPLQNVEPPINTSSTQQVKKGALFDNTLLGAPATFGYNILGGGNTLGGYIFGQLQYNKDHNNGTNISSYNADPAKNYQPGNNGGAVRSDWFCLSDALNVKGGCISKWSDVLSLVVQGFKGIPTISAVNNIEFGSAFKVTGSSGKAFVDLVSGGGGTSIPAGPLDSTLRSDGGQWLANFGIQNHWNSAKNQYEVTINKGNQTPLANLDVSGTGYVSNSLGVGSISKPSGVNGDIAADFSVRAGTLIQAGTDITVGQGANNSILTGDYTDGLPDQSRPSIVNGGTVASDWYCLKNSHGGCISDWKDIINKFFTGGTEAQTIRFNSSGKAEANNNILNDRTSTGIVALGYTDLLNMHAAFQGPKYPKLAVNGDTTTTGDIWNTGNILSTNKFGGGVPVMHTVGLGFGSGATYKDSLGDEFDRANPGNRVPVVGGEGGVRSTWFCLTESKNSQANCISKWSDILGGAKFMPDGINPNDILKWDGTKWYATAADFLPQPSQDYWTLRYNDFAKKWVDSGNLQNIDDTLSGPRRVVASNNLVVGQDESVGHDLSVKNYARIGDIASPQWVALDVKAGQLFIDLKGTSKHDAVLLEDDKVTPSGSDPLQDMVTLATNQPTFRFWSNEGVGHDADIYVRDVYDHGLLSATTTTTDPVCYDKSNGGKLVPCAKDLCLDPDHPGVQLTVPSGYTVDADGWCSSPKPSQDFYQKCETYSSSSDSCPLSTKFAGAVKMEVVAWGGGGGGGGGGSWTYCNPQSDCKGGGGGGSGGAGGGWRYAVYNVNKTTQIFSGTDIAVDKNITGQVGNGGNGQQARDAGGTNYNAYGGDTILHGATGSEFLKAQGGCGGKTGDSSGTGGSAGKEVQGCDSPFDPASWGVSNGGRGEPSVGAAGVTGSGGAGGGGGAGGPVMGSVTQGQGGGLSSSNSVTGAGGSGSLNASLLGANSVGAALMNAHCTPSSGNGGTSGAASTSGKGECGGGGGGGQGNTWSSILQYLQRKGNNGGGGGVVLRFYTTK